MADKKPAKTAAIVMNKDQAWPVDIEWLPRGGEFLRLYTGNEDWPLCFTVDCVVHDVGEGHVVEIHVKKTKDHRVTGKKKKLKA